MPIELQPPPTGGVPLTDDDYDAQNKIIQTHVDQLVSGQLLITNFSNLTIPQIASGVNINHGGAWFVSIGPNSIAGSPADGRVYIKVIASGGGDQLLPSFTNSAVGFFWNFSKNGFYNGAGDQLLPYVLVKSGSNWYKHTLDNSENKFDISAKITVKETQDLGSWDMDTDPQKNYDLPIQFLAVYSTLTANKVTEFITNIDIKIRNDLVSADIYNITGIQATVDAYYVIGITAKIIAISRNIGGFFDSTSFNDPAISRGNINWEYKI